MNKVKLTAMIDAQKVRIPNRERTIKLIIEESNGHFVIYNAIDIPVSKHNVAFLYNELKDLAMQGLFTIYNEDSYTKLSKQIKTIIEKHAPINEFVFNQIESALCTRSSANFNLENADIENIILPRSRDVLCI